MLFKHELSGLTDSEVIQRARELPHDLLTQLEVELLARLEKRAQAPAPTEAPITDLPAAVRAAGL